MADERMRSRAEAFLAELEAEYKRLGDLIAANRKYLGLEIDAELVSEDGGPNVAGVFLSMSIGEAAQKLLAQRRKPMTTPEITEAIQDGGVALTGATPINSVNAVLHRESKKDDAAIVSVGRGKWALASWHHNPQRFRRKVSAPAGLGDAVEATAKRERLNED